MKTKESFLLLLGLLLLPATGTLATQMTFKPDYRKNWPEYENIWRSTSGLVELKGEVTEIGPTEIVLESSSVDNCIYRVKLTPETKIFCNGVFSRWQALAPVAPGAYFEGQLLVNGHLEAVAVNAHYYGEECFIKNWYFKEGILILGLVSVSSVSNFLCPVNRNARLPSSGNWLQEGQAVYILFNNQGEIRAIFLPD